MPNKTPIKVLISVEGGCVQEVIANTPMEIYIVDHDNLEAGDDTTVTAAFMPEPPTHTDDFDADLKGALSDYTCSKCSAPNNDGEGYDGLCGGCADKKEQR